MSWDFWLVSGKNDKTELAKLFAGPEEDAIQALIPDQALVQAGLEILRIFPPLEDALDSAESPSPWSVTPEVTEKQIWLALSYSRVDEFFEKAGPICEKHGLLGYDPQSNQVMG